MESCFDNSIKASRFSILLSWNERVSGDCPVERNGGDLSADDVTESNSFSFQTSESRWMRREKDKNGSNTCNNSNNSNNNKNNNYNNKKKVAEGVIVFRQSKFLKKLFSL